jgi:hypothetical protein
MSLRFPVNIREPISPCGLSLQPFHASCLNRTLKIDADAGACDR